MKHFLPVFIFSLLIASLTNAQSDSVVVYINKDFTTTSRDSAYTYIAFVKESGLWHGKEYYIKNNKLKSEGNYLGKTIDKPVGSLKNFKEDGSLQYTSEYDNTGKITERTSYYKNGNKKTWILYNASKNDQKAWDENGREMKGFVVEKEARFKGGADGWRKYLEKHLNANVAADAGAPVGQYSVKVQFIVSKEGYVSNVKATEIPKDCKPCAKEIVSVLAGGPEWEPAIQDGEPVIYRAIQYVTFVVEESNKKGKKS